MVVPHLLVINVKMLDFASSSSYSHFNSHLVSLHYIVFTFGTTSTSTSWFHRFNVILRLV